MRANQASAASLSEPRSDLQNALSISYSMDSSKRKTGFWMDSSAMASVMRETPSASMGVVSTASSSAFSAARTSPLATEAMCSSASSSMATFCRP